MRAIIVASYYAVNWLLSKVETTWLCFWRLSHVKGQAMYTDGYDDNGEYYSAECDDEEMPATERELADDAQWKVIQKNTFTRWTNEHLKQANKGIADLETDLSDGLRLCALIEVLSGKKFKRINKRPNFRSQKLENVTTALRFLEEDEGIKIVNIGEYLVFSYHL